MASTLWGNLDKMLGYDIHMYSCEGGNFTSVKDPYRPNIEGYMNAGGRMFLSHMHMNWLRFGSDEIQATADYIGVGDDLPEPSTGYVNTTFPKGDALADWLVVTGATPVRTELEIWQGQHSVAGVVPPTQDWITVPENPEEDNLPSIQYMTFNTPTTIPEEEKCGRVVFTDLHLNITVGNTGGDDSDPDKPFPTGCRLNEMSPQSKALEFMFFDLSACIQPDTETPEAPPPPPPPGGAPPPAPVPPPPPRHREGRGAPRRLSAPPASAHTCSRTE